jgi:type II secretory pathway pseudopilin PulG
MAKPRQRESGASLVMMMAVLTILLVLAASMVALLLNAQSSRNRDRQRAETFNVAEASLDDALARLAAAWPDTESLSPVWEAAQEESFRNAYLADGLAAQYPTLRVKEWFYDNSDSTGDGVIDDNDLGWDASGPAGVSDGKMYVEVQAQDGDRSTRIRVLAERQPMSLGLPGDFVFYGAGDLWSHGGSIVFGVDPGSEPDPGEQIKAYVGEDYENDGSAVASPLVVTYVAGTAADIPNVFAGSTIPPLESVMNQAILDGLRATATATDNYYTSGTEVDEKNGFTPTIPGDPESIQPMPPDTTRDDLSGLVYVKTTSDINWQVKGQWNTPKRPGILVIDGAPLKVAGNSACDYYGLVYLTHGTTDLGGMRVHGIVISASGQCELGGNQTLNYNREVWENLSGTITASVRIVPNTWRELPPLAGAF